MTFLSNITRSKGDPQILETGRSSLGLADRLGRWLGWLSLGLGATQLIMPRAVTRFLGLPGREGLVPIYGLREIGSGILSLSLERSTGLWSRVAGDGLDIVTLMGAVRRDNPKRGNAGTALMIVLGVAALDVVAAQSVTARHARPGKARDYRNRSGFPQGLAKAREAARRTGQRSGRERLAS